MIFERQIELNWRHVFPDPLGQFEEYRFIHGILHGRPTFRSHAAGTAHTANGVMYAIEWTPRMKRTG